MSSRSVERARQRADERARRRVQRERRARRAARRSRIRTGVRTWLPRAGVAVVALAIVVTAIVLIRRALAPGPGSLPPPAPLHAYAVSYTVDFSNGNVHNEETDTVERPYNSVQLVRRGGQLVTGQVTNDAGLYLYNGANGWSLTVPGKQRAANDPQPQLALARALHQGLARVRGHDTVAGRRCTIVRVGDPLGQPLTHPATGTNHADVCLDATGVVLDYTYVLDGKVGEHMRAVRFDPAPALPPTAFLPGPGSVSSSGLIKSGPVTPTGLAELSPRVVPAGGTTYVGGLVRVDTASQTGASATTTLLFQRGDDLVTADYEAGGASPTGTRVDLGGGHVGYLALRLDVSSLVAIGPKGNAVLLSGTDPSLLEALGRGLTGW